MVEGNTKKNDLGIRPLRRVYEDNYIAFTYGVNHGYMMMGIFNTEEAAEEYITMIRTLGRDDGEIRLNVLFCYSVL